MSRIGDPDPSLVPHGWRCPQSLGESKSGVPLGSCRARGIGAIRSSAALTVVCASGHVVLEEVTFTVSYVSAVPA